MWDNMPLWFFFVFYNHCTDKHGATPASPTTCLPDSSRPVCGTLPSGWTANERNLTIRSAEPLQESWAPETQLSSVWVTSCWLSTQPDPIRRWAASSCRFKKISFKNILPPASPPSSPAALPSLCTCDKLESCPSASSIEARATAPLRCHRGGSAQTGWRQSVGGARRVREIPHNLRCCQRGVGWGRKHCIDMHGCTCTCMESHACRTGSSLCTDDKEQWHLVW